ncbi:winged helix-turn-helix domain-containing protein [Chitinimonas sp. BJB300]|uniref:winged helix-turn-helix domain-containing protein n=1 Tax=Chitinimonas sp. BJB300 TaxID=1559339 RepID=UPI001183A662|nr:winged helix-turn-helix domain-containing protein [Chitinimonas sp. BJB300]TSJ87495.1 transposase [Chitinimonas sp. BJB300]
MDKEDGRKLSRQEQHERRKQAVRLHRRGMPIKEVAASLGVAEGTVRSAVKSADAGGLKALAPKPTGRSQGQQRCLSANQELHIQRLICKNRPEQLKLEFALWTRAAVLLLVKQEFGLALPIRTMGEYLKRWGFTPQKPLKRAYRHRGGQITWPTPATPPGMRVRTGRFEKLRLGESWNSQAVEIGDRQRTIQHAVAITCRSSDLI